MVTKEKEALFEAAWEEGAPQIRPEDMEDYIRFAYTKHPCADRFFNISVKEARRGNVTLSMPLAKAYTNSGGFLYGGILAALADAVSLGLIVSVGKSAVTIDMSMNFVRSSPVEGTLFINGTVRHNGGRTLTLLADITDEKGRLLADVQTTMLVKGILPEVPDTW